jgi:hypothetical protein
METNENKVREAIASIIKRSLSRIRSLASKSDFRSIDIEAYHIHNLPAKLLSLSTPALKYYWDIERPEYILQSDPEVEKIHKADWEVIDSYLRRENNLLPPPNPK